LPLFPCCSVPALLQQFYCHIILLFQHLAFILYRKKKLKKKLKLSLFLTFLVRALFSYSFISINVYLFIELLRFMGSSSTVRIDYPFSSELSGSFMYRKLTGQMPLRLSSPKYSQLPNANLPALILIITERRSSSLSNPNHRTPFFQPYPLGNICPLCLNLISVLS
jgi:hypothetical protein